MQPKFELREASPGYLVLTCRGGLSWEEREHLAATVEQYLVGRPSLHGMVLDMGAVEYVNSAGLGALFQVVQRVRSRGAQLAFANVPPAIHRLLTTVGMVRLAAIAPDTDAALIQLAQSAAGATSDNSPPS
jgi:anti-anti-sigma factor